MDQTSKIKDVTKKAFAHSKIEAKHNNKEIIAKTRASQLSSKRVFKKPTMDAADRAAKANNERDGKRFETLAEVEQQSYTRLVSFYESKKNTINGRRHYMNRVFAGCRCLNGCTGNTTDFPTFIVIMAY
jgi:hypothetical protein